jgi:uncharacterized membrane protein
MFAKLSIPLLALAVTFGLAATPAEARGGGGGFHGGGFHGGGFHGGGYHGHGFRGGGGFYDPFWCPYPPYCMNP